jgi:micrococcal nuclease
VTQLSGRKVHVVNNPARLTLMIVVLLMPGVTHAWEGKVIAVDRADQIKVMKDVGKVEIVRLYGIHSPAGSQPFGETARLYTHKRVVGKIVQVDSLIRDPFNRVIAWLYIDGECLNKELLRQGMTWWYRKYVPFETELAALEEEARNAKMGLWAYPSPIPPWEFNVPATPAQSAQGSPLGKPGMIRQRLIDMFSGQEGPRDDRPGQ